MSFFPSISQNVTIDTNNSSVADIGAGATWNSAGTGTSTLGVSGIQVNVKMSQDGLIYVDQGPDGTNWNVTDTFTYYTMDGGDSFTVQATDAKVRVRVKNISSSTATGVFINTALCPIVEAVPRALDDDGYFKTAVYNIADHYGFEVENTPLGEMRVVSSVRLVGAAFQGTTIDTNFWTATPTNSATITQAHSQAILTSGTNTAGSAILQSFRYARFVPGAANRFRGVIQLSDTGKASNVKRWGPFDGSNGAYFKLSGTTLSCCSMATGSETAVASTAWSNNRSVPDLTVPNIYEIYYINQNVYFAINDTMVHVIRSTTYWTDAITLPVRADNINAGNTASTVLTAWAIAIHRLGESETSPAWKYIHGTLTATVLKYGAGVLHRVVINNHGNNGTISLYDALSATNPIALITPPNGNGPITMEFNLNFYTGLTVVVGTAAAEDVTIVYE